MGCSSNNSLVLYIKVQPEPGVPGVYQNYFQLLINA